MLNEELYKLHLQNKNIWKTQWMKTMNFINDKHRRECCMLYKKLSIETKVLVRKQERDTRYIKKGPHIIFFQGFATSHRWNLIMMSRVYQKKT
jgi:hypothetical protein